MDDDLDQDGFVLSEDCDDTNAEINSAVAEISYNGLDDDLDQDGFVLSEDCDDTNAEINSASAEIPYNGLDDDCDAETLDDDLGQDGFVFAEDCDDTNAEINSDAIEIPNNGIDENCDDSDFAVSVTDLSEIEVTIFPNPTTGIVQIEMETFINADIQIKDYTGRLITQLRIERNATIDLSAYPNGIYILLIEIEGDQFIKRIIKI